MPHASIKYREVRAAQTDTTLTVYQAYAPQIAEPALRAGRFVPPFKRERMTWIKPSFLWMMYRSGWATKPGQERILAVEILREGFEWALAHAALTHFERGTYPDEAAWRARAAASPVRVQWDPERNLSLAPLGHRAIQIGVTGEAARRYVDEWIVGLADVTDLARRVAQLASEGRLDEATDALPHEKPYPLSIRVRRLIGAS
jgi:hypothetical protein